MRKVEVLQAAIDSPQEYARLGKACKGEIQNILAGWQTMTVYKPLHLLADTAAAMAVKMARGEVIVANGSVDNGFESVPSVLNDIIAVDKDNMMETVVKDGFHTVESLR